MPNRGRNIDHIEELFREFPSKQPVLLQAAIEKTGLRASVASRSLIPRGEFRHRLFSRSMHIPMRHSSVNTTLAHYIKDVPEVTANGMAQVEHLFRELDVVGQVQYEVVIRL